MKYFLGAIDCRYAKPSAAKKSLLFCSLTTAAGALAVKGVVGVGSVSASTAISVSTVPLLIISIISFIALVALVVASDELATAGNPVIIDLASVRPNTHNVCNAGSKYMLLERWKRCPKYLALKLVPNTISYVIPVIKANKSSPNCVLS